MFSHCRGKTRAQTGQIQCRVTRSAARIMCNTVPVCVRVVSPGRALPVALFTDKRDECVTREVRRPSACVPCQKMFALLNKTHTHTQKQARAQCFRVFFGWCLLVGQKLRDNDGAAMRIYLNTGECFFSPTRVPGGFIFLFPVERPKTLSVCVCLCVDRWGFFFFRVYFGLLLGSMCTWHSATRWSEIILSYTAAVLGATNE